MQIWYVIRAWMADTSIVKSMCSQTMLQSKWGQIPDKTWDHWLARRQIWRHYANVCWSNRPSGQLGNLFGKHLRSLFDSAVGKDFDGIKHIKHINISFNSASIGYAICFYSYSTWQGRSLFLEDLYVRPAYRKQGTGARMFREVAAIAVRLGCRRLDFHVLSWNPACEFYNRLGATNLTKSESWQFYRVEEQQLGKLAEELKS